MIAIPRFVFQIRGAGDYWSVATEDGPVFGFVREYEYGHGYQISGGAWFPTLEGAARELWIRKQMREAS